MTEQKDDGTPDTADPTTDDSRVGISDDQLPEDLVPGDDNPLAEGLPDGEAPHDLVPEGGLAGTAPPEGTDEESDQESDED